MYLIAYRTILNQAEKIHRTLIYENMDNRYYTLDDVQKYNYGIQSTRTFIFMQNNLTTSMRVNYHNCFFLFNWPTSAEFIQVRLGWRKYDENCCQSYHHQSLLARCCSSHLTNTIKTVKQILSYCIN